MITFTIPGPPLAKARARFNRATGHAYTPKKTASFERTVGTIAAQHFPQPIEGAVKVTIFASFEPAKSWSKKKRADHLNRHHTQKPDGDNVAKAIKDALNRIAWADDSQVADLRVVKVWGPTPRTVVTVESLAAEIGMIM